MTSAENSNSLDIGSTTTARTKHGLSSNRLQGFLSSIGKGQSGFIQEDKKIDQLLMICQYIVRRS